MSITTKLNINFEFDVDWLLLIKTFICNSFMTLLHAIFLNNAAVLNPLKGRDVKWLHLAIQV